ncbi:tetratricopeptide repeat protein 5-like [Dendronephthya gigantea]|uniref:tetratricopeptide repeat protein 5-like n=1 Tax=Dendronephthya gigantea TaxID=151771 RepID=UPI001068E3DA|nr:tetratricopeptide repeat protein 5-like [Dendronephthya gigantea]XP_028392756.1 tetratricopeptide repeat protein 5-like [Dendronephthya gigantea]
MNEQKSADEERAALEEATKYVDELYDLRDHYFVKNGVEKASERTKEIGEKMTEVKECLDRLLGMCNKKSQYFYLLGKTLNVMPAYDPQAQEALSRAVKLDPLLVDAWNCLGECLWKKGDVEAARNCFTGALEHSKNKMSLRSLSMVLRQLGKDSRERVDNIKLSVEKAKEAVSLDITDGVSWYILGNAYLSLFFSGAQSPSMLKQCLAAYARAELDTVSACNPDLYFNRAMVYRYQEEYKLCLDGFQKALVYDPAWEDAIQLQKQLLSYLQNISDLIQNKGRLKAKRLNTMMSSLKESDLGPYAGGNYTSNSGQTVTLEQVMLSSLNVGLNANKVISGKVVGIVPYDEPIPFTFSIVDKEGTCYPVMLYNLRTGCGVIVGDAVAVPEPYVQSTDFQENDKIFKFQSIRVDSPLVLVVNKRKLGRDKLSPSVLSFEAKSE